MKRIVGLAAGLLVLALIIGSAGCDKQRIVTSTEIVHDTKYIELPADTVVLRDTLTIHDTVRLNGSTDTVRVTVYVHDTITKTVNHYDTITVHVVDTVKTVSFVPTATTAIAAMEAQTDPQVLQFALDNFGLDDGWIMYLSPQQMEVTSVSSKVWDIFAYVDYWSPDWSGYYPLEVSWRLTYNSGDPTNPNNWTMGDPPAASPIRPAGVSSSTSAALKIYPAPAQRDATQIR